MNSPGGVGLLGANHVIEIILILYLFACAGVSLVVTVLLAVDQLF